MNKEIQVGDIVSFDPNEHFGTHSPYKSFAFALIVQIDPLIISLNPDIQSRYLGSMFLPHYGRYDVWLRAKQMVKET